MKRLKVIELLNVLLKKEVWLHSVSGGAVYGHPADGMLVIMTYDLRDLGPTARNFAAVVCASQSASGSVINMQCGGLETETSSVTPNLWCSLLARVSGPLSKGSNILQLAMSLSIKTSTNTILPEQGLRRQDRGSA